MGVSFHTIELLNGSPSQFNIEDRAKVFKANNVVTAAGGSAGASVTYTLTFPETLFPLDVNGNPDYQVFVSTNVAGATLAWTKTQAHVVVTLTPASSANTLAAGLLDILVIA